MAGGPPPLFYLHATGHMSYQVLARKWRPKNFSEMVGQEHVVQALSNALENDRLHHAYLFTGTRGVGKTTLARILSKSLNCETGITATPCGECSVCREVDEGRFVDLIEVDAASKTGVDDTRELLENVPYAPVRGRYKVYLIDEVHMFSNHSFNALLKTLEEPPPHVKFLLATTDPQKVPVTVLSRCLQFNLKRLPVEQIQGQFEHILRAEQVRYEAEGLSVIARAADGSMRDGLSLLDQAIAFGGGEVKAQEVKNMLGVVAADQLPGLLSAIHSGSADEVLATVEILAERAPDFAGLLKDLLTLLHRVALVQASAQAVQASWGEVGPIQQLAEELAPEDVQLYYQIALVGQRDLPMAPDARSGFEMIMLRMLAFRPDGVERTLPAPAKQTSAASGKVTPANEADASSQQKNESPAKENSKPSGLGQSGSVDLSDWMSVRPNLSIRGMAAQLADHASVQSWDGKTLTLLLDASFKSMQGSLAEKNLAEAVAAHAGMEVNVVLGFGETEVETPAQRQAKEKADRQKKVEDDISSDPLVVGMQDAFAAEVVEGSIKPMDN